MSEPIDDLAAIHAASMNFSKTIAEAMTEWLRTILPAMQRLYDTLDEAGVLDASSPNDEAPDAVRTPSDAPEPNPCPVHGTDRSIIGRCWQCELERLR